MRIEITQHDAGLSGAREVWVRVLSTTVVDWPRVLHAFTAEQEAAIFPAPGKVSLYPHRVTTEEKAEHGFSYEEFWIYESERA